MFQASGLCFSLKRPLDEIGGRRVETACFCQGRAKLWRKTPIGPLQKTFDSVGSRSLRVCSSKLEVEA